MATNAHARGDGPCTRGPLAPMMGVLVAERAPGLH